MQFLHEDDLVEIIASLIGNPVSGTYNVANDGEIKYSEIAGLAGKRMMCFPDGLIHPLLDITWKLRWQSASPAAGLEFIKYPPLVSTEALKTRVNFRFRYSSRESIAALLKQGNSNTGSPDGPMPR
jgi:nucleoside-diphosphate-sugar epimerase